MVKEKQKTYVECECGTKVYGFSEHHAKQNLKLHKTSKKHKELMELKRRWTKESKKKNNNK
jgi:hypothetical protein